MPQLPTYTAQLGGATPNGGRRASEDLTTGAIAPPDFSSLATGVTKFANAILADKEDSEARSALIASSEVRAKYARELDAAATDGRDLETLKESMTADLAKVGENFQTRRGNEALALYTANTGLMFDEQANSIEVRRAASVARLEGSKFLNSASAIIQSNPAYLPFAEKDAEAFGDTLRRVSPQQRAEIVNGLKQELNAASAISAARIDPEGTKTRLEKGEWNLNPDQRNTALNKAETEIRAKRAEESYAQAQREREIHKADDKARDTHFADIIKGSATRRSIMDDVTLLPATREHLINVMETRAKEGLNAEKRSDPTVRRNLWMAINAPEGDPSKVYNGDAIFAAVRNGSLNVTDANQLNSLVAAQKDENGRTIGTRLGGLMSVVGRALSQDPQFTAQPALVAEIQMDYQARVFEKVEQLRKDKKNPSDVFDPTSRDYVGSREFIQESIQSAKTRARGDLPNIPNLQAAAGFGTRPDGSAKGLGYLGVLKRPDGGVSSELSIGVKIDGKDMEIPSMVPGLSKQEINTLLTLPSGQKMPESIVNKAVEHARSRLRDGKPVFATIEDAIPVGTPFVDPNGVTRVMSKQLLDALKKQAPAGGSRTSSGKIGGL